MTRELPDILAPFVLPRERFRPLYRERSTRELREKVEQAREMLRSCTACPRHCGVNRLEDARGVCLTGYRVGVASAFPHYGEEDVLRGWQGSGTIFFTRCNLQCVFCQNFDISRLGRGEHLLSPEELAALMLHMQTLGCHNLNLVTPEHVVPQVVEALVLAVEKGLRIPVVYNTSAYDDIQSLRLLEGLVDIYMPDFKLWFPHHARRYLRASDYPEVARQAIQEMHRQVGVLRVDERGLAVRGVLLRHLVMPGLLGDTFQILRWVRDHLGPDTYLNLMDQYTPAGLVSPRRYPEIHRPLSRVEFQRAVAHARALGLWRLDRRWRALV